MRAGPFIAVLVLLAAPPAMAQLVGDDTIPGSSCVGFAAGATRMTADPDFDGAEVTLICDGSVWQPEKPVAASPDRGIQFNSGGRLAADSGFVFDAFGNLGIGIPAPAVALDVAGVMRAVDDALGCTSAARGAIRFNSAGGGVEVCDGAAWGGIIGAPAGANTQIQFNDNGVLGASAGLTYNTTSDILYVSGGLAVQGPIVGGYDDVTIYFYRGGTPRPFIRAVDKNIHGDSLYIGWDAGLNAPDTLTSNVAIGAQALRAASGGSANVAIGTAALNDLTNSRGNVAIGADALRYFNGGTNSENVAIGMSALAGGAGTNTGVDNVAVGTAAGSSISSGTRNVLLGHSSGRGVTSGSDNTIVGRQAGYGNNDANKLTTGSRNILLGNNALPPSGSINDHLNIGNTIYGDLSSDTVGIGTPTPNQGKLEVKGGTVCVDTDSDDNATSCIANESDVRLKRGIRDLPYAIDTLMKLRPVSFEWRHDDAEVLAHYPLISRFSAQPQSIGLIAQDVQKVVPEAVEQETVGDDEVQYLQLDYTKLVPVLIKAAQEQQAQIDRLSHANEMLSQQVTGLKAHTGYGISRAGSGLMLLIVVVGCSAIGYLIGCRRAV